MEPKRDTRERRKKIWVNGQRIPPEAVDFELMRLVRFYREHMPEEQVNGQLEALREKAVEQAIGAKLLIEQAERLDIPVRDDEVDRRIAELEKEAGGGREFDALLARQGTDRNRIREQVARGRRIDKLVSRVVSDAPDPTESQVEAHFKAHREEYRRRQRAQVQHILIQPEANNPEARNRAREKLREIRERLEHGASFAEEAAAHSDCPSGRQAGGSLGWVSRGMLVASFDKAVFQLPLNTVSDIIESELGIHLVRKTAEEAASEADFDQAREQVRDFLRHEMRGEMLAAYVRELREKAEVRIEKPEGT